MSHRPSSVVRPLQQNPRLHSERMGHLLERGNVDAFQGMPSEYVRRGWLAYTGPLGELVGGRPALPVHVFGDVPADHGAKDSLSRDWLTSTKASVSIQAYPNRTPT